jgi:hypothetical protein
MSAIPKHLPAIKGATAKRTITDKLGFWKDQTNPTESSPNERKIRSGDKEFHAKTYFYTQKEAKFKITELEGNGQKYRFYVNVNDKNEPTSAARKQVFDGNNWK